VVLSDEEKKVADKPPTEDVRAYEYYLRGRQYFHQWTRVSIQHARRMFERAIEVDPNFATAYAAMADCCAFMYMYWDGSKSNLDGADSASRKALELGPNLAEAHASRGFALSLKREHAEAREEFERAIALNPRLYEAHYLYARACRQEGELAEAVKHFEAASAVRPEDYQSVLLMAGTLKGLGKMAESEAAYRRGLILAEEHLELAPDDGRALCLGAAALMTTGKGERAIEWATLARAANPTDATVLYNVACVYALGKAPSDALDALDQAVANGFGHREWLLHDSDLDAVRADPRFEALLAKL
jgi:tetratricopeptide (TPR) repeat protein